MTKFISRQTKALALAAGAMVAVSLAILLLLKKESADARPARVGLEPKPQVASPASSDGAKSNSLTSGRRLASSISQLAADMPDQKLTEFKNHFYTNLKPAIDQWAKVYEGHLPFDPEAITPDKFLHKVGEPGSSYGEFVFYLDGITFGVRHFPHDSGGKPHVGYLASKKSRALSVIPERAEMPILQTPVNKREIAAMAKADIGEEFWDSEIEIFPSGLSGSINGGAIVWVGGDGHNPVTTRLDLVFDADGKLIYYMKGLDIMAVKSAKRRQ